MAENGKLEKLIKKSVGLPVSDFSPLPSGTYIVDADRLPQVDIIHLQSRVDHCQVRISQLVTRIDQLERVKIKEFRENDVYEVKKWIERLERRISLLESGDRIATLEFRRAILWSVYMSIAASIFVSLLWWLYG